MKNRLTLFLFSLAILSSSIYTACVPEKEKQIPKYVEVDFSDSVFYQIWRLGAGEKTDSLLTYLDHEQPSYRWAALQGFTSYNKEFPLNDIAPLLRDPVLEVRSMAAYVLGQSHNERAVPMLMEAFDNEDSTGTNTIFNAAILEAVGKTGKKEEAVLLSGIQTYLPSDSLLTLAQVRAIYQMGVRGIHNNKTFELMLNRATDRLYASSVRVTAADYLSRFHKNDLDSHQFAIIRAFNRAEIPELQIQLAALLPYCSSSQARNALEEAAIDHVDYRVRIAAVEALKKYNYEEVALTVQNALEDVQPKVSHAAATFFVEKGEENEAVNYRSWAQKPNLPALTRYELYGAALKNLPFYYQLTKTTLNGEMKSVYAATEDPYHRALILQNMAWDPYNVDLLIEKYRTEQHPAIESTAVKMLGRILSNPQFRLILGGNAQATQRKIASFLREVIEKGPNGPLCEASLLAADQSELMERFWGNELDFIQTRYANLDLPRQLEAAQLLEQLMQKFDMSYEAKDLQRKMHFPDPHQLQKLTDSTEIEVITNKGNFRIRLFPENAPATISNLLHLIDEGFYEGKLFHRVVPNFVAQTGCPDGDGFGSLDYVVPSELGPLHYTETGFLGMASAGPDTECTQWFITYRPTPHLDGRFTIWGKLSAGMETVHQLMIGDRIANIKLINLKNNE